MESRESTIRSPRDDARRLRALAADRLDEALDELRDGLRDTRELLALAQDTEAQR